MKLYTHWGIWWWTNRSLGKNRNHIIWKNARPLLFDTRKEAKEHIDKWYGYIKTRKDLRVYPHWWRLPKPVKVNCKVTLTNSTKGGI